MKVAVVGMGLFGRSLAVNLARAGAEVIAIDAKMELVERVKEEVTVAVRMDATDEKELRAQGVHEVDVLVACIGDNFEANQLLVLLGKQMGIKKVVARAPSEVHEKILRKIGADEVILPEISAAEDAARLMVEPSLKGYFELIEGHSVAELDAPASFDGKTLMELDLKHLWKVNLVAITRPGENGKPSINVVPLGKDVVRKGDVLTVAGRDEDIKKLISGRRE